MKLILYSMITLCLAGCTVFTGEGDIVTAEAAKVGKWDRDHYRPTLKEAQHFGTYYVNRNRKGWTPWFDCDKKAIDCLNQLNLKYAAYPHGGQSVAAQMHMIIAIETCDKGVVFLEPQTGVILK